MDDVWRLVRCVDDDWRRPCVRIMPYKWFVRIHVLFMYNHDFACSCTNDFFIVKCSVVQLIL